MAYILEADIGELITPEDFERQKHKWQQYLQYLESVRHQMPKSAHEFASASWHYDTADSRSLHDSWVDSLVIREPSKGTRHEIRSVEIEVRLFGPYHNGNTTLRYEGVHAYSLQGAVFHTRDGHGDWLCDEIRFTEHHVVHEVEFESDARWTIECQDITWTWQPLSN